MKTPKRKTPTVTISFDPAILEKLEKGSFNTSKLVNTLLTEYFSKNSKPSKK